MKKTITVLAALFLSCYGMQAQDGKSANLTFQRPRLVVGIVIDQMRWDYLYRYQQRYTEGGFKRLSTRDIHSRTLASHISRRSRR